MGLFLSGPGRSSELDCKKLLVRASQRMARLQAGMGQGRPEHILAGQSMVPTNESPDEESLPLKEAANHSTMPGCGSDTYNPRFIGEQERQGLIIPFDR